MIYALPAGSTKWMSQDIVGSLLHLKLPQGMDHTLERRHGAKIRAKGVYRDPMRSSHSHLVKVI